MEEHAAYQRRGRP